MSYRAFLVLIMLLIATPAGAEEIASIAGTWNVTSTANGLDTCGGTEKGSTSAYVWIVSTKPDGTVSISVQGETGFPKLAGLRADNRVLLLGRTASPAPYGAPLSSSWFDLRLEDGKLVGTRRFSGAAMMDLDGKKASTACFTDFDVVAKR